MNQPNKPESSTPKWIWAVLALFVITSAGIAIVGFTLMKKSGVKVLSFGGMPITPIDLTAFYDKSGSWNTGSEWQDAPRGAAVLGGVPFEVNGVLRLTGRSAKNDNKPYREEVKGIPVGKKFARLHVLHIVSYSTSQEGPYARLTLRYADGSATTFPMIYGQHGRDWHRPKHEYPSVLGDPNSKVVWRGEYTSGRTLRIFKTTFTNPKPESEVTAIDLASENASPNATILSMSIGPANLPKPKDDLASLPEPEEVYDGEIKFTAVEADSGKPVANLQIKVNGTESGGSFRTPDAVTDAKGECIIKHPGDSTRTLTLVASGEDVAIKTIRWRTADGEIVPSEYTLRMDKGVVIGGIVQDETGQPVVNAKISLQGLGSPNDSSSRDRLPFSDASVSSDSQGRWEFRSLPKGFGQLRATITHSNYVETYYLSDAVDRAYGGERIKFAMLRDKSAVFSLRKGLLVTGRVLNEAGQPVSGAKLLLGNSRFESRPNTARSDETGAFRLPGAKAGTTYLTVQASGYAPQMQQVMVDAKTEPVELKLAPGKVFKAKVIDEFGTPVRTARVTVDMWQNRQTVDLSGSTDTRGTVTINSAPASGMSGSIYKAGYMNISGIQFVADGEEHTFTLRKSATITGDVVDADTKEPIERFDVTRGQGYVGNDQIYWQNYNMVRGSNGMFSLKMDQQSITALKVDADDHLPAIVSLGTNGETHFSIALKKGSGPKGIVLQPDGQPAARAQLAVVAPGRSLNVGLGGQQSGSRNDGSYSEADAKGAFSLRPQPDAETIIVMHPSGYAEASFSNFVSGSSIKLQKWGVIEGVLIVANQPATNQPVMLTPGMFTGRSSYWYDYAHYRISTDSAGKFVISNAPPGERRMVRLVQMDANSWSHSQPTDILVKPGEVTHVTIGGNGHLLIGKLALSDPSLVLDMPKSGRHTLNSFPRPPPFKSQEEYRAWAQLPETIEAQKKARSYVVQTSDTGTFRIEEVLPGKYDLNFAFAELDANGRPYGRPIGSFTTNIVVPLFEKGVTNPPIDLGDFVIPVRPDYQPGTSPRPTRAAANRR